MSEASFSKEDAEHIFGPQRVCMNCDADIEGEPYDTWDWMGRPVYFCSEACCDGWVEVIVDGIMRTD